MAQGYASFEKNNSSPKGAVHVLDFALRVVDFIWFLHVSSTVCPAFGMTAFSRGVLTSTFGSICIKLVRYSNFDRERGSKNTQNELVFDRE